MTWLRILDLSQSVFSNLVHKPIKPEASSRLMHVNGLTKRYVDGELWVEGVSISREVTTFRSYTVVRGSTRHHLQFYRDISALLLSLHQIIRTADSAVKRVLKCI
jgi:hypothetical protein